MKTKQTVWVISGEGECGTIEEYVGKRSARAIRARNTRESCGGDRWVRWAVTDGDEPEPYQYMGADDLIDLMR